MYNFCERAPTHKRVPTPYFLRNVLYRVKVYWNDCPLLSELGTEFEKHSLKL